MEGLNANLGSLGTTVGIRFTEATTERIVATMPVDGNTSPYGDAAAILAETVGSMMAVLHAGRDRAAVGVSISVTHHHPFRGGTGDGHVRPAPRRSHDGDARHRHDRRRGRPGRLLHADLPAAGRATPLKAGPRTSEAMRLANCDLP